MIPNIPTTLLILLTLINTTSLFIMLRDKRISLRHDNAERIPEGIMFFMASIFGGVGIYVGMFLFRHKTRKWYFIIGIPLLIIQNLATLYLLQTYFTY